MRLTKTQKLQDSAIVEMAAHTIPTAQVFAVPAASRSPAGTSPVIVTMPKTKFFGLHFCYRQHESHFIPLRRSKITQNNGHYAVQGHSRSPLMIPLKSRMRLPMYE